MSVPDDRLVGMSEGVDPGLQPGTSPKLFAIGEAGVAAIVSGMGGGGSGGGNLEARIAKVEAAVEGIQRDLTDIKGEVRTLRSEARTDFRTLFAAVIFVALGLAALMAKGFHWIG